MTFKRFDRWTGGVKYIYHGNDGTHMPWNDTAQLDFTKPEVREAVIQTILHVARRFSIIRFVYVTVAGQELAANGNLYPNSATSARFRERK